MLVPIHQRSEISQNHQGMARGEDLNTQVWMPSNVSTRDANGYFSSWGSSSPSSAMDSHHAREIAGNHLMGNSTPLFQANDQNHVSARVEFSAASPAYPDDFQKNLSEVQLECQKRIDNSKEKFAHQRTEIAANLKALSRPRSKVPLGSAGPEEQIKSRISENVKKAPLSSMHESLAEPLNHPNQNLLKLGQTIKSSAPPVTTQKELQNTHGFSILPATLAVEPSPENSQGQGPSSLRQVQKLRQKYPNLTIRLLQAPHNRWVCTIEYPEMIKYAKKNHIPIEACILGHGNVMPSKHRQYAKYMEGKQVLYTAHAFHPSTTSEAAYEKILKYVMHQTVAIRSVDRDFIQEHQIQPPPFDVSYAVERQVGQMIESYQKDPHKMRSCPILISVLPTEIEEKKGEDHQPASFDEKNGVLLSNVSSFLGNDINNIRYLICRLRGHADLDPSLMAKKETTMATDHSFLGLGKRRTETLESTCQKNPKLNYRLQAFELLKHLPLAKTGDLAQTERNIVARWMHADHIEQLIDHQMLEGTQREVLKNILSREPKNKEKNLHVLLTALYMIHLGISQSEASEHALTKIENLLADLSYVESEV
jgi:hypothetical protein